MLGGIKHRFLERYINVRKSYKGHLCSEGAIKIGFLIYGGGNSGRQLRSRKMKRCDEKDAERQRRSMNYGASGIVCMTEGKEHES